MVHISWYYFRPDASSLTAQRARDGEAKLRQEVCDLCDVIFNLGTASSDGKAKIQFGELFQVSNWKINEQSQTKNSEHMILLKAFHIIIH